jgi:hypothetical protein
MHEQDDVYLIEFTEERHAKATPFSEVTRTLPLSWGVPDGHAFPDEGERPDASHDGTPERRDGVS